ncbi:hypothetical protein [Paenibacillus anseongense]|uniref:hypothetical protein n=1 Tax=Paenibacillus TaxID=44249 RepID=UPI002DB7A508|nr:hypothetical protein [Paenibacillus anseongense]MEC0265488.1 hypothetical protein [Paenibacillus anseongense]
MLEKLLHGKHADEFQDRNQQFRRANYYEDDTSKFEIEINAGVFEEKVTEISGRTSLLNTNGDIMKTIEIILDFCAKLKLSIWDVKLNQEILSEDDMKKSVERFNRLR